MELRECEVGRGNRQLYPVDERGTRHRHRARQGSKRGEAAERNDVADATNAAVRTEAVRTVCLHLL